MKKPTEEQIRQGAHELWEQNHRPDGRDDEFWHQAEKELNEGITPTEKSETFPRMILLSQQVAELSGSNWLGVRQSRQELSRPLLGLSILASPP